MPPFPSIYKLIVTPVVAILSDLSILESLKPNPGEVDDIFDHPLEARPCLIIPRGDEPIRTKAFLDPTIMSNEPKLSPPDSEKWPYPEQLWVRHIGDATTLTPG
jgi:coenzyme A diphosphatase NUDT7